MSAYYGHLRRFVEFDRLYGASRFASAAAYAFFLIQKHASAVAQGQGVNRADFLAFGYGAAPANDSDVIAGQTTVRAYSDCALVKREVVLVHNRTDEHTSQAAYTLVHSF